MKQPDPPKPEADNIPTAGLRLILISALALTVASAAADTLVTIQGEAPSGEVCRFRAGDGEDPFRRWLSSQDLTCVASGSRMTFPSGLWNVFARRPGAVSLDPILVDGASAPENLTIPLAPAATLLIQLPAGHTGALYSPKYVAGLPVTERTTVPAAEDLWLLVLVKAVPVGVVVIPPTDAGSERAVDARNVSMAPAVLGWLQVPDNDRRALKTSHGTKSPNIRVAVAGHETAAAPLPAPEVLNGAFVLVQGILGGDSELQLAGRGWLPVRQSVSVEKKAITLLRQPIVARATATLVVNWSTLGDLAALDRSLGSCEPQQPPRFELTISSCTEPTPGSSHESNAERTCHPIRTEPLSPQETFGSVTIEEVPPGSYRAQLRFGKLPPVAVDTVLPPLEQRPIHLQALYLQLYGSLTRGGQPLGEDARIELPGGGAGFSTRESGEYHAVLTTPFGADAKIDIITCRGERVVVLADRPAMRMGGRLDIDIPDNSLTVTVIDTFTRQSPGAATLRYRVMATSLRGPMATRVLTLGDSAAGQNERSDLAAGRFVIKAVPPRQIRLEVTSPGYQKQELEPFTMGKSENKDIEVQLVPLSGSQGKVLSPKPFEKAAIFWFSATGVETEHADLNPDGTFLFGGVHLRDETMTVVSQSHPLWITRAPPVERGKPLTVRFPDAAPVRDAEVWIPYMPAFTDTLIGVAIDGVRVPSPALVQHLGLRGIPPFLRGTGPYLIPALAETGPIDIVRGPSIQPMRAPIQPDVAALSAFAAIAIRRLDPGVKQVVFEGK